MIRRDQRLLGTHRQVAASQNPLGSVTRSGLDAHLVQVLFPDSHLSFRSSRADSYQLPNRNLLICDEETPKNVTEDFWRSSNQINA